MSNVILKLEKYKSLVYITKDTTDIKNEVFGIFDSPLVKNYLRLKDCEVLEVDIQSNIIFVRIFHKNATMKYAIGTIMGMFLGEDFLRYEIINDIVNG